MNRATRFRDVQRALVAFRAQIVDVVIDVHGRPQRWIGTIEHYEGGCVRLLVSGTTTEIEFRDEQVLEVSEAWFSSARARLATEQAQAARLGRMRSR